MAEPLSVAASVVGLVTAAVQMSNILYKMGSTIKDAPVVAQNAATELNDISLVLAQLQKYIDGRVQASTQRLCLITVEHITATLTGCVMTFSELDAVLKSVHVDTGLRTWDRAVWLMKKDKVTAIISRLQSHKSTLSLMLNIMQCVSQTEAEISMDRSCDTVNKALQSNAELSMRLRNVENIVDPTRAQAPKAGSPSAQEQAKPGANRQSVDSDRSLSGGSNGSQSIDSHGQPGTPRLSTDHGTKLQKVSAFEELLHRSRVYRHAAGRHSESSLVDDGRSTLAFSICSSMTLGEISKISVYALPVYAFELSNADFYTFGKLPEDDTASSTTSSTVTLLAAGKSNALPSSKNAWWKRIGRSPRRNRPPEEDLHSSSTSQKPEGPPVFGIALTESVRYANVAMSLFNDEGESYIYGYAPIVVMKCGVYLKEKATDVEYIFETQGSPKAIQELQKAFDNPPRYGKGLPWDGYTVFDAASLLLRYLTLLPEPVIPYEFYERFIEPFRTADEAPTSTIGASSELDSTSEKFVKFYQPIVHAMPGLHRQLLLYLLDLLAVFASKYDLNKMTLDKLAIIFQHGILRSRDTTVTTKQLRLTQDVLSFLIDCNDYLLFDPVEKVQPAGHQATS